MYIHKIKLTNIRGFKSLEFDLQRPDKSYAGWTVFTGDNGAGKSTLLKSIAIGLTGRDTARSLQPSFNKWVRHDAPDGKGHIELEIFRVKNDDALSGGGKSPGEKFPALLLLANMGKETLLKVEIPEGRPKTYQTPERTIWANGSSGGLDSCVLLHLLAHARASIPFELQAMHVHHGISPNADSWATFCQAQCAALNVPLTIVKVQLDEQSNLGLAVSVVLL